MVAGAALTLALVGVTYFSAAKAVEGSAEILLAWTCLASRNLIDENFAVIRALEKHDLPHARERLARIVGRDTRSLDEVEMHRALIETLAESAAMGSWFPIAVP